VKILICGHPNAGKTTLSEELSGSLYFPIILHTDAFKEEPWSQQSDNVLAWITDTKPPYIIEGVTVVRALRKWLKANPGSARPCDVVFYLQVEDPSPLGKGCDTIFAEIQNELIRRGVAVGIRRKG
jgi:adenylate kinase family enzyme